jgi:hypothetical protein
VLRFRKKDSLGICHPGGRGFAATVVALRLSPVVLNGKNKTHSVSYSWNPTSPRIERESSSTTSSFTKCPGTFAASPHSCLLNAPKRCGLERKTKPVPVGIRGIPHLPAKNAGRYGAPWCCCHSKIWNREVGSTRKASQEKQRVNCGASAGKARAEQEGEAL